MAWSDLPAKPNILILITDQQRYPQHWPPEMEARLASMARLKSTGLTFERAFCAACECSPSRSALVTSTYPEENGITQTEPPRSLPLPAVLPNLGSVLTAAGYQVVWKGKWHLTDPVVDTAGASLSAWGFEGWDSPDAGTTLNQTFLGAGTPGTDLHNGNDARFAADAIAFLESFDAAAGSPFCLVVSLVNPHDVHMWNQDWASVGFPQEIPAMGVGLPGNRQDPLATKPTAQLAFRQNFDQAYPFEPKDDPPVTEEGYANFYAYLHTLADQQIVGVLDALAAAGLADDTLIVRFADHGEMALSHGLREKMYNAYRETVHVPLVFSNPRAFPVAETTRAFASLLDLAPTLATVAGAALPLGWKGRDLTPVLADPTRSVQDAVVYTYDDDAGLDDGEIATHIRSLRKEHFMYSVYFSETSAQVPMEFELYDLVADPGELTNLLNPPPTSAEILDLWQSLHTELTARLPELAAMPQLPDGTTWPVIVGSSLLPEGPRPFPAVEPARFVAALRGK